MQIRVRTFARFREILGGDLAIDLPDGATMAAVLAALRGRAGEEGDAVFDESGGLREYVILMHNGKRVISKEDYFKLEEYENEQAASLGIVGYKLKTNQEMLAIVET